MFNAMGGYGPYSWSILVLDQDTLAETGLPQGLTMDASSGMLTGTPVITEAVVRLARVTVRTVDQVAVKDFDFHQLAVVDTLKITTASPLPKGQVDIPYQCKIQATGGLQPYAWSLVDGSLPPGMELNADTGVISGSCWIIGDYSFTIRVVSDDSQIDTKLFSLRIRSQIQELIVASGSLPTGVVGAAYTSQLQATGGDDEEPYAWSTTGLPANGVSLSTSGIVSGVPVAPFSIPVTFKVESEDGQEAETTLQLTVYAVLEILTTSLPPAINGSGWGPHELTAQGGLAPYTWGKISGDFSETIVSGAGQASGDVSYDGSMPVGVGADGVLNATASSTDGQTDTQAVAMKVVDVLGIAAGTLPTGYTGTAYNQAVAATGGLYPFTWSAEGLPAGLSINSSTGAITGTPTVYGQFTATIRVKDAVLAGYPRQEAERDAALRIIRPVAIATTSLPTNVVVGSSYSATLSGTGGEAAFTWSVSSGSLPSGLSLNPSTGAITGNINVQGTSTFTIKLTDGLTSATRQFSIVSWNKLAIVSTNIPSGLQNRAWSGSVTCSGGAPGYTWTATGLPSGISISGSGVTATLAGTPTVSGSFGVTVRVQDTIGQVATTYVTISLVYNPPLSITTASPLTAANINLAYNNTLQATGGSGSYTWSQSGLKWGLALSGATVTGTPTTSGTISFTATVKDTYGNQVSKTFSLTVNPKYTGAVLPESRGDPSDEDFWWWDGCYGFNPTGLVGDALTSAIENVFQTLAPKYYLIGKTGSAFGSRQSNPSTYTAYASTAGSVTAQIQWRPYPNLLGNFSTRWTYTFPIPAGASISVYWQGMRYNFGTSTNYRIIRGYIEINGVKNLFWSITFPNTWTPIQSNDQFRFLFTWS
jgi:hypothetical protein